MHLLFNMRLCIVRKQKSVLEATAVLDKSVNMRKWILEVAEGGAV